MFPLETEDVKSFKLDRLLKQVEGRKEKEAFPVSLLKTILDILNTVRATFQHMLFLTPCFQMSSLTKT